VKLGGWEASSLVGQSASRFVGFSWFVWFIWFEKLDIRCRISEKAAEAKSKGSREQQGAKDEGQEVRGQKSEVILDFELRMVDGEVEN